jgi:hypothetical protein
MPMLVPAAVPQAPPTPRPAPEALPMFLPEPEITRAHPRFYMPYASLEDLRSAAGLGIINESDAWLTGRPYGLPGTATVRLMQRPGGYHSPNGYHYDATMVGGGFGDADTQAINTTMQQLVVAQQAQQAHLKRIAFWQALTGGLVVGSIAVGTVLGIVGAVRQQRRRGGR